MLKLKGCPKCKGDMVDDKDAYGRYEQCMQCGYLSEIQLPKLTDNVVTVKNNRDRELAQVR